MGLRVIGADWRWFGVARWWPRVAGGGWEWLEVAGSGWGWLRVVGDNWGSWGWLGVVVGRFQAWLELIRKFLQR